MNSSTCVLVVDDDRNDIFLLRRGFHCAGLMTDFLDVPDGVLALDYLRGRPPYEDRTRFPFPNLLLLDIKMPRINGLEVLAWLAAHRDIKGLAAVVLSSSTLAADRELAFKLGARDFLVKPNEASDWVDLARALHQRWLAQYEAVVHDCRQTVSSQERSVGLAIAQ